MFYLFFKLQGTIILSSLLSVHHDKNQWSEPDVFRPERFLNENGDFVLEEPLLQFGLGKVIITINKTICNLVLISFGLLYINIYSTAIR